MYRKFDVTGNLLFAQYFFLTKQGLRMLERSGRMSGQETGGRPCLGCGPCGSCVFLSCPFLKADFG
jgi:hypothetical protein